MHWTTLMSQAERRPCVDGRERVLEIRGSSQVADRPVRVLALQHPPQRFPELHVRGLAVEPVAVSRAVDERKLHLATSEGLGEQIEPGFLLALDADDAPNDVAAIAPSLKHAALRVGFDGVVSFAERDGLLAGLDDERFAASGDELADALLQLLRGKRSRSLYLRRHGHGGADLCRKGRFRRQRPPCDQPDAERTTREPFDSIRKPVRLTGRAVLQAQKGRGRKRQRPTTGSSMVPGLATIILLQPEVWPLVVSQRIRTLPGFGGPGCLYTDAAGRS